MVMAVAAFARETGALSPLPVKIVFGAAANKGLVSITAQGFVRVVEPFAQVVDAVAVGFELLGIHRLHFPAIGGEVQLSPRLGLSCDALVEFRFGYSAGSGPAKLLRLAHRS